MTREESLRTSLLAIINKYYAPEFDTYDFDGIAAGVLELMSAELSSDTSSRYKNFDGWNGSKKGLEQRVGVPQFQVRQIWWCAVGVNLGFEQDGKNQDFERPVLILRKFNKDLFFGIPLSSKIKKGEYYFDIPERGGRKGQALLSQSRVMSSKRLLRYMYRAHENTVSEILDKVNDIMHKKATPPATAEGISEDKRPFIPPLYQTKAEKSIPKQKRSKKS